MKKNLSFLKNTWIAHRGLFDNKSIPENSMPAFEKALAQNIPIEFDIHLLKDGKVVVFHDDNLKRMTGVDKRIRDCTYEEICSYTLLETKEKIPLLQDVLEKVNGKVLLDIEFKYDNKAGKLERASLPLLDVYKGPFVVKSFHPLTVLWFRLYRKKWIRGQLSENMNKEQPFAFFLTRLYFNFLTRPDFIAYKKEDVSLARIQKIRKKYPVLLYVVEQNKDFDLSLGDGYIFENRER